MATHTLPQRLRLTGLTLAALPLIATAQDSLLLMLSGDEQLVSLATGTPQRVSRAPAVTTVITAEDIRATGSTQLSEILETVPGLHVSRSGGLWQPLYSIRGILRQNNPEVLVMVNGIPITNGFYGDRGRLMVDFPVEHVARIEVIRGPGSALHGAEAVSGVINIITKVSQDINGSEIGLRAGSFGSYDTWVQHGSKWGPVEVASYLRLGRTDGFAGTIAADAQTALDQSFGTHASRAPGSLATGYDSVDMRLDFALDQWRLRVGHIGRPHARVGAGLADALDPSAEGNGRYSNIDLTWHNANPGQDWALTAQASYYDIAEPNSEVVLFPVGSALPLPLPEGTPSSIGMVGQPQHWERQQRLNLSANYTGFAKHKLRFGAGYNHDDLYRVTETKNFTFVALPGIGNVPMCLNLECSVVNATEANGLLFLSPHLRRATYLYAQDEWSLAPDWQLTAGIRHDRYSDFGSTTNPRLAVVWDTAHNLTSKLMFGRAFRAPSFVELYIVNNPVSLGNVNLRPETISTTELAFAWQPLPELRTELGLFRYQLDDLIRPIANDDPTTGNTSKNAGSQRGHGLELGLSWDAASDLRLSGHYAYQRSTDETTNQDAGLAPHHHVYARADWRLARGWTLSGQINHVADRHRQAGDSRPPIPDYTIADLTLRSTWYKRWQFSLSLRNLFNTDAREPTGAASATNIPGDLPLPGRNGYLEVRYQM